MIIILTYFRDRPWYQLKRISISTKYRLLCFYLFFYHRFCLIITFWKKSMTNLDSILKSRNITLLTKVHIVKAVVFSHPWMWDFDIKESWAPKNWFFWTVVLKTLESPLDCKEIKPVNPKGNQPWIFIGRTDAEAEALILWPPDAKRELIGKDSDAGKDWRQKGKSEDEMVR